MLYLGSGSKLPTSTQCVTSFLAQPSTVCLAALRDTYSGFGRFTLSIIMDSKGEGIYSIHASEEKPKKELTSETKQLLVFPHWKISMAFLFYFFLLCIHLQQTSTNNKSTDRSASIHRPPRSTSPPTHDGSNPTKLLLFPLVSTDRSLPSVTDSPNYHFRCQSLWRSSR